MSYVKKYDLWSERKKEINKQSDAPFFFEGEIWWCSLGVNIDIEMDGKNDLFERPVLVIKKINLQSAWVIPLTSTKRDNLYMYPLNTILSYVSISQMRNISNKRFLRRITKVTEEEYAHIIIRIKYILTSQNETPPKSAD